MGPYAISMYPGLEGLGFRAVVEWESSKGLQFGRLTISVANAVASLQVIAQTMGQGHLPLCKVGFNYGYLVSVSRVPWGEYIGCPAG